MDLPDQVDEALHALWRGDSGAFQTLLSAGGDGGTPIEELCQGLMSARYGTGVHHDPGGEIEGFRILREIGRGGMGVVYAAEQKHPRRLIALELIRPGIASDGMLRRFEHEVRLLARLQHPGIAQLFEAGALQTAGGPQPYFVMELVEGRRLSEHARERGLDVRQRLELFCKVCDAVQHAHQKGVIHRDLKPANILVVDVGAVPDHDTRASRSETAYRAQPKVLDFGVARATEDNAAATTIQTSAGQLIGTLPYMSPEQVAGDPHEIDTRSDVYSLGVVLYELLSDRLPHDCTKCSIPEAARIIREETPVRLSSFQRSLQGEVETIVAKAMEKDRSRRYQSAASLAEDIRRYSRGEPIEAKRESTLYVLRKNLRRYRGALAAAALAIIAVAAFAVYAAVQADRQGRLALRERESRESAEAAREQAASAAARAEALNAFLRDMLSSVDPQELPNPEVTVREILDQATQTLDAGKLRGQPEIAAAMRDTLGQAYAALGLYPQADSFLLAALDVQRASLGEHHADVAATLSHLGMLRHHQGRYDEAESFYQEALAIRQSIHGLRHPEVATILHDLAALRAARHDLEAAEPLLREALSIRREAYGQDHPDVAASLDGLAVILNRLGRSVEAEPLYQESLAVHQRVFGEGHPRYALALNNLGYLLQSRGDLATAEPMLRQALHIRRKALGDAHPSLVTSLSNLAAVLRDLGNLADAEPLARDGLEIRRKTLPPDHADIARSALLLGLIKFEQNQAAEAEPLLRECRDIRLKSLPAGHYLTAEAASALGECLTALERYDEAESLLLASYPVIKAGRGELHERTVEAVHRLVRHYEARGRLESANAYRNLLSSEEQNGR